MDEPVRADGERRSLAARILQSLPAMTRFVRRRMGPELASRESASDIVQSTYRELLKGASRYEDRGDAGFQRWMQGAAENKLRNRARHWRAQRRQDGARALDGPDGEALFEPAARDDEGPIHHAMLREEIERLHRAFDALTPEYRLVLTRSQIDGASYDEIGRELGRTPEAVRKLVARALSRLSSTLDPDDDD